MNAAFSATLSFMPIIIAVTGIAISRVERVRGEQYLIEEPVQYLINLLAVSFVLSSIAAILSALYLFNVKLINDKVHAVLVFLTCMGVIVCLALGFWEWVKPYQSIIR